MSWLFALVFLSGVPYIGVWNIRAETQKIYEFVTLHKLEQPNASLCKLIIEEAFRRNGLKTTFQTVPAKRALEMVETGQVDGDLMRLGKIVHKNYLRIDEPIYSASWAAYAVKEGISLETWEDLKATDYRIGYHDGSKRPIRMIEKVLKIDKSRRVLFTSEFLNGFNMLLEDRFDILIIGSVHALILLEKEDYFSQGVRLAGTVEKFNIHSFLNAKHADTAQKIAETIRAMKKDGTFEKLKAESGFNF